MVSAKEADVYLISLYANHFVLNETTVTVVYHPGPADGPTYAEVYQYASRLYPARRGTYAVHSDGRRSNGFPPMPAIAPRLIRQGAQDLASVTFQDQSTETSPTAQNAQPSTSSSNSDAPNNPPPPHAPVENEMEQQPPTSSPDASGSSSPEQS